MVVVVVVVIMAAVGLLAVMPVLALVLLMVSVEPCAAYPPMNTDMTWATLPLPVS